MNWYQDIRDIKAAGSSLSSTVTFGSLAEMINSCERDFLLPNIGKATRDLINAQVGNAAASAEVKEAVRLYKKSLAFFLDYKYPTFRSVEQGEGGSYRLETAEKKTPFKYQEVRLEKGNLHEAWEALEELLLHLETATTYKTAWIATPQYQKARSVFAHSAAACREAYGYTIDRYTYETLKPCIADTHRFQTRKQLPKQFYDDLMAKYKAATVNPKEQTVIDFLLKIETYYAIENAMYKNLVKVDGQNVVTTENQFANDAYQQAKMPTLDEWRIAHSYHNEVAISYAHELKDYVITNKADFPKAVHTDAEGTNGDGDAWLKNETPCDNNNDCTTCGRWDDFRTGMKSVLIEM
jgi:hypothetical protein